MVIGKVQLMHCGMVCVVTAVLGGVTVVVKVIFEFERAVTVVVKAKEEKLNEGTISLQPELPALSVLISQTS